MTDQPHDRDRVNEKTGDEMRDRNPAKRQKDSSRADAQSEPTDTLEDRNLSGSSTWATLPDRNPSDDEGSDTSDSDPGRTD